MRKVAVITLVLLLCAACDFFLKADSGGLKIEIGDNSSDNKTHNSKTAYYIKVVGDSSPIGIVEVNQLGSGTAFGNNIQQSQISKDKIVVTASIQNFPEEVAVTFIDICTDGLAVDKIADFYSSAILVACDLSNCTHIGYDMFSYAERNGFDAYCSLE